MKKILLVTAFCGILGFAIPATPLYADFGFGGRIDLGFDLLAVPVLFEEAAKSSDQGEMAIIPLIPLFDLGFYGQLTAGPFRLGAGLRGFSFLIFINLFYPTLQAELDLGSRVTLNAKIGGGLFWVFPFMPFAVSMYVPEGGIWFRLNESNRNRMQLGLGALSLLYGSWNDRANTSLVDLRDYGKKFIFYFAFKASFNFDPVGSKKD